MSRRTWFPVIAIVLFVVVAEAVSALTLAAHRRSLHFLRTSLTDRRALLTAAETLPYAAPDLPDRLRRQPLHPYVGYVSGVVTAKDPLGFANRIDPIRKRSPDRLIVAITGGSFAYGFSVAAPPVLEEILRRHESLRDREIEFVRVAQGGFKQPQQLMALNYLMSLGAEFDVVINLDGFNEIVLPAVENVPEGVPIHYPRLWRTRTSPIPSLALLEALGRTAMINRSRVALAQFFDRPLVRFSPAMNLLWEVVDRLARRYLGEARVSLLRETNQSSDTGAGVPVADPEELRSEMARLWSRCSLLIDQLASAHGFVYLHFLQPNQYVDGSKPMGSDERRAAIQADHPYRRAVQAGYSHLQEEGRRLQARGVRFHDLTYSLADVHEPVYVDTCCHLSEHGYRLLAPRVAEALIAALDERQDGG